MLPDTATKCADRALYEMVANSTSSASRLIANSSLSVVSCHPEKYMLRRTYLNLKFNILPKAFG
jgi:hypothetical protein